MQVAWFYRSIASPSLALSAWSTIYRRVFQSRCKLGGSKGGNFLDGDVNVPFSCKTYYWDVGVPDLGLIAFKIDGPSWFGYHQRGIINFNTPVGVCWQLGATIGLGPMEELTFCGISQQSSYSDVFNWTARNKGFGVACAKSQRSPTPLVLKEMLTLNTFSIAKTSLTTSGSWALSTSPAFSAS
jgi:hypothetical protein